MYWPGHVGIALLLYAPVASLLARRGRERTALLGLAGVLPLAVAPDVDLYVASLAHRGVTHTVWGVLACGAAFALVVAARGRLASGGPSPTFGFLVGALAGAGHLLGDVVTPMGVRPLSPLLARGYTLDLVYASNAAANRGLLVAGVLGFGVALLEARVRGPASPADL